MGPSLPDKRIRITNSAVKHFEIRIAETRRPGKGLSTIVCLGLQNDPELQNYIFLPLSHRLLPLDEVKEEDNRITDAWKEDASNLVLLCL